MTPEAAQDRFISALRDLARTGQGIAVRDDTGNMAIILPDGNYSKNVRPPEMNVKIFNTRV